VQYHGAVRFNNDSKTIFQASEDNVITMYDVSSKTVKGKLQGHTMPVISIDIQSKYGLPIGTDRVVSGSADGTVKIWKVGRTT
jgi:WD40 repeat protein